MWQFANEIQIGDIVFARKGVSTIIGIGKVLELYEFNEERPFYKHILKVEWFSQSKIDAPKTMPQRTISQITDDVEPYKAVINNMTTEMYQPYTKLLEANKNLILTGAPGTGKTFMAKEIAKSMGASDANIKVVQFHPSYDYSDFVEGIRPTPNNGFVRMDGVFKEFCKNALIKQNADIENISGLNDNPKVWKVSLMGTGENPVRTDCLENGYIRIGWAEYGNEDFFEYNNFYDGGINVLRAFQSGMNVGDIVVSCFSDKETDAIGIITGDYDYREEGGDYPRYRNVKWLVKNIKENIVEANGGKKFTLATVYQSNIKPTTALEIVNKYEHKDKQPKENPFVFIIDEINRGELSKILGELFASIEADYRGEKGKVQTQYQNLIAEGDLFYDGFFIPKNVYIIGTMNDIDRSVESMDFAMRRRFAWKEVTAEESQKMFETHENFNKLDKDVIKDIINRMNNLNAAIIGEYKYDGKETKKIGDFNKDYQIGAAYFLKYVNYKDNAHPFDDLWKNHLEILLKDYLRGEDNSGDKLELLRKAYNGESSHTDSGQQQKEDK